MMQTVKTPLFCKDKEFAKQFQSLGSDPDNSLCIISFSLFGIARISAYAQGTNKLAIVTAIYLIYLGASIWNLVIMIACLPTSINVKYPFKATDVLVWTSNPKQSCLNIHY